MFASLPKVTESQLRRKMRIASQDSDPGIVLNGLELVRNNPWLCCWLELITERAIEVAAPNCWDENPLLRSNLHASILTGLIATLDLLDLAIFEDGNEVLDHLKRQKSGNELSAE